MHVVNPKAFGPPPALMALWRIGGVEAVAAQRSLSLEAAVRMLIETGTFGQRCTMTVDAACMLLQNPNLSTRKAAQLLGVSHQTVMRWRRKLRGDSDYNQ